MSKNHVITLTACVFVVAGFIWTLCFHFFTHRAPGFTEKAFNVIKPGDDLRDVTNALGMPVRSTVIRGPAKEKGMPDAKTNYAFFPLPLSDSDLLMLHYSKPRWIDHYMAYEIFITNGVVMDKRSYWYWD